MIIKEDLEERYAKLSNKELMDIIGNKFKYTELAVVVALQELSKRNINEEDIKSYKEQEIQETKVFIVKNVIAELSFFQKIIFYILWIPFLSFLFKRSFIDDGFVLKVKQANYYSWFGFIFCLLTILVGNQFNWPDLVFWIIWIACFPIAYYFDEHFNRGKQMKKYGHMFSIEMEEEEEMYDDKEEDIS